MAELFFTSDLHFDHTKILHLCNRPWLKKGDMTQGLYWNREGLSEQRTTEMNEGLVNRWNAVVSNGDMVYILGDFAFKRHGHWINELNGTKIMIMGNHDKMRAIHREQFTRCYDFGLEINVSGYPIVMSHYPLRIWGGMEDNAWHLHGHCHNRLNNANAGSVSKYGLSLDVGVDVWDYAPVDFDTVRELMAKKLEYLGGKANRFDWLYG